MAPVLSAVTAHLTEICIQGPHTKVVLLCYRVRLILFVSSVLQCDQTCCVNCATNVCVQEILRF